MKWNIGIGFFENNLQNAEDNNIKLEKTRTYRSFQLEIAPEAFIRSVARQNRITTLPIELIARCLAFVRWHITKRPTSIGTNRLIQSKNVIVHFSLVGTNPPIALMSVTGDNFSRS